MIETETIQTGQVGSSHNFWRHLSAQFVSYAFVGGLATIVDWGGFWLVQYKLNWHYQLAVIIGFLLGAITNYLLNKFITFRDHSRYLVQQIGVYCVVSALSWLFSAALMYVWIEKLRLAPMLSRVLTSGVLLLVNFVMHKMLTFNRRLYERIRNFSSTVHLWKAKHRG